MSIQHLHTTPPGSFTNPPLTPPPTDEKSGLAVLPIVQEIKNRKAGNSSISCWSEYTLEPEGYKDLLQRLQSDGDKSLWGFVKHKLRYDYFPSTSRFIIKRYLICNYLYSDQFVLANIVGNDPWLPYR